MVHRFGMCLHSWSGLTLLAVPCLQFSYSVQIGVKRYVVASHLDYLDHHPVTTTCLRLTTLFRRNTRMGGRGIGPSCSIPTMVRCILFKTPSYLDFFPTDILAISLGGSPSPFLHSHCFFGGEVQHLPLPPLTLYSPFREVMFNTSPHALLTVSLGEVQHLPLPRSCRFVRGRFNTSPSCVLAVSLGGRC